MTIPAIRALLIVTLLGLTIWAALVAGLVRWFG